MAYDPFKTTFGVGARVKVVRQRKYPGEKLLGLIGTVRTDSGSNISVIFDAIKNARSSYGCFYFKPVELVEVDEDDNEIKEDKKMEKITGYLNVVKIKAITDTGVNPHIYEYANYDEDLAVNDVCVVTGLTKVRDLGSTILRGLSVATVVAIEERNDIEVAGEVVAKIDMRHYDNRVRSRIKAAELKAKMEARAKQLQDIALYQMLAKDDPDMAALLEEYQGLPRM